VDKFIKLDQIDMEEMVLVRNGLRKKCKSPKKRSFLTRDLNFGPFSALTSWYLPDTVLLIFTVSCPVP
jgi:hypothetical protein